VTRGRHRLPVLGAVAAALFLLAGVSPAHAADDATIDHTEISPGQVKLLVSVPGTADVDLTTINVSIDGADTDATATSAGESDAIARTTMLAIDTSGSMQGARIAAAKAAALTYLDAVPENVDIGIVTFNSKVKVLQQPSSDRDQTRRLIRALKAGGGTMLYQGVSSTIEEFTGIEGQHQILLLSDGQDNSSATLPPVLDAIKKSQVRIDAVSLDQKLGTTGALKQMTSTGKGNVLIANSATLEQAFSAEAEALARQILVTATVPDDQSAASATVEVRVEAGGQQYATSAFVEVKKSGGSTGPKLPGFSDPNANSLNIPRPVMYGALGAIALGVIGLASALVTSGGGRKPATLADQLQIYSASEATSARSRAQLRATHSDQSTSLADTAREAAARALASNSGFEEKIALRLEGAGMALKSSEWLLLHLGIAFVAGMFGLLLSGGSPIAGGLLLFLGVLGPWVYLGLKRSRRLKAFDAGLADTLQLMSGSLSAGLSLAQSLDTIVREGSEPITSEFKRVIVESRLGVPLEDALDGVADRMQSKDFRWVVMAIRIQREVGGNLAELLNTVAATLREREYLRRHVQALSAEGRLSCWILGGLPPAFMGYLVLTKPSYVHPMFTTGLGILMLVVMGVLLTVGIFWMSKVAKVDI